MRKNNRSSVVRQCTLYHFTWIATSLAVRALEQIFRGNDAMLGIQEQHQKNLLLSAAEFLFAGGKQSRQIAKTGKQHTCKIYRALPGHTGAKRSPAAPRRIMQQPLFA